MPDIREQGDKFDQSYGEIARKIHKPLSAKQEAEFIQKPYCMSYKAHNYPAELTEHHEEIKNALAEGAFIKDLRKKYKVSRYMFECYVNEMPDLKQARADALEDYLDEHEKNLHGISLAPDIDVDAKVLSVQLNGTKFFLERRGQTRGYGAKLETNEVGNGLRVPVIVLPGIGDDDIDKVEEDIASITEKMLKDNPAQE